MWGKGHSDRAERPVIGNPTLANKSLDDSVYESLSPIASPAVDRGTRAPTANSATSGHHRDASSVYSRDGWEMPGQPSSSTWHDHHHPPGRHSPGYKPNSSVWHETTEISPPDSPVSASGARQGSGRVSPLEDEPPGSMQTEKNKHASHHPVFRKFPRKDSLAAQPGGSKSEQKPQNRSRITRWDYFSGEPTTSGTGKAAQAAPGHAPFQPQPAPKQPASQSGILNWSREQLQPIKKFAEARSRLTKNENTLPHTAGRLPMTNPLHEKQRGRAPSRADLSKTSDQHQNQAPPISAAPGFRPTVVTTISAGPSMSATPEKRSASRNTTSDHHPPPPSTNQNSNTAAPPRVDLPQTTLDSALADLHMEEQPPSRFSSTTYEPTEPGSATDSPRDSVAGNESTENLNSIMSRKRPVPSGMITTGQKPIRKPTPSQASEDSTTKPLPECPPEKQAETRIEALEARRDTLARRKANIETIIHELTQVVQPSSIAYDIAVRDEVKRTVSSLNSELADVKREDHEVGLTLFRAYKKRDEQGHYTGSTGLWVKRVTS